MPQIYSFYPNIILRLKMAKIGDYVLLRGDGKGMNCLTVRDWLSIPEKDCQWNNF